HWIAVVVGKQPVYSHHLHRLIYVGSTKIAHSSRRDSHELSHVGGGSQDHRRKGSLALEHLVEKIVVEIALVHFVNDSENRRAFRSSTPHGREINTATTFMVLLQNRKTEIHIRGRAELEEG